jgi:nucleoside-diphosphate-sugar epimerase
MSKPDVLVTGACGHLGYALMCSLSSYGFNPVGIDILPSTTDGHEVLVGSIADPEFCTQVFQRYPDLKYVLHTATLHKPHVGSHTKSQFIDTNIHGTLNLLENAARRPGQIEGFIFTSTTSTFGKALAPRPGQPAAWIDEDVVPVPKNIYGTTKVAAEDLCQLIHSQTGMPTLVLRTSRFFPEEDDDDEARANYADDNLKVCELLYRRVDVADVVSAHVCAMREAKRIGWGKYIISAPPPFTKSKALLRLLDRSAPEAIIEARPLHAKILLDHGWMLPIRLDRVYDSSKAVAELKWEPKYTFERALELIKEGKDWKSPLTGQMGKRGYHATPTGVYTK